MKFKLNWGMSQGTTLVHLFKITKVNRANYHIEKILENIDKQYYLNYMPIVQNVEKELNKNLVYAEMQHTDLIKKYSINVDEINSFLSSTNFANSSTNFANSTIEAIFTKYKNFKTSNIYIPDELQRKLDSLKKKNITTNENLNNNNEIITPTNLIDSTSDVPYDFYKQEQFMNYINQQLSINQNNPNINQNSHHYFDLSFLTELPTFIFQQFTENPFLFLIFAISGFLASKFSYLYLMSNTWLSIFSELLKKRKLRLLHYNTFFKNLRIKILNEIARLQRLRELNLRRHILRLTRLRQRVTRLRQRVRQQLRRFRHV
jgi:hypothetical protein